MCGVVGVIGQPELVQDARFTSDPLRRENEPALAEYIDQWAGSLPVDQVVHHLSAAGIPASSIQSVAQAWASPQAVERGLASTVTHPDLGVLNGGYPSLIVTGGPCHIELTEVVEPTFPGYHVLNPTLWAS